MRLDSWITKSPQESVESRFISGCLRVGVVHEGPRNGTLALKVAYVSLVSVLLGHRTHAVPSLWVQALPMGWLP